jgi:hypothetical protein
MIFTSSQPNSINSLENAYDVEETYKIAFFVKSYHDIDRIYGDTSLIEWTVIGYDYLADGTYRERQTADVHECNEDDYK